MTCKGQIAEQNANEHVLAIAPQGEPPIEPKFFLVLLTSYTHVFNTEARIFDHFLNFSNRANGQWTIDPVEDVRPAYRTELPFY